LTRFFCKILYTPEHYQPPVRYSDDEDFGAEWDDLHHPGIYDIPNLETPEPALPDMGIDAPENYQPPVNYSNDEDFGDDLHQPSIYDIPNLPGPAQYG